MRLAFNRPLLAGATALVFAMSGLAAPPARADSDTAGVIAGLGALAIIGAAIAESDHHHGDGVTRYGYGYPRYGYGYRHHGYGYRRYGYGYRHRGYGYRPRMRYRPRAHRSYRGHRRQYDR